MDLPVCPYMCRLRLHSFKNRYRYNNYRITHANKMTLFFFFVAFGVAKLQPFLIVLF